ncbi:SDR family NAD(P)-dependent oxidoreductase, partial [Escherichia coli]
LELSAAKVASLRQRFGEHILAVEGNVTCYADYQRAVDQILTRSGKLDCFIGNAGIWDHNASLVNTPAETLETGFHELFNVNVLGYLPPPEYVRQIADADWRLLPPTVPA